MWLFLSDVYLSVVAHREDPNVLLVRSRIQGDIERILPGVPVHHTPRNDYAYRALVPRQVFAQAMADRILAMDYGNFKGSVWEDWRHRRYYGVYNAMLTAGRDKRPARGQRALPLDYGLPSLEELEARDEVVPF